MAKNKKKQPKQGHPGRSQHGMVSVGQVKIDRGIDAMTPQFVRWYSQLDVDTETSLMVLAAVRETLYGYADSAPLESVAEFDVRPLFIAMEELIEFQSGFAPAEQADQLRGLIHLAWADYLDYLEEMGLWEKSTQDLQWLRNKLEVSSPFAADDLEVSAAKGELEDLLLTDMTKPALVHLARNFARWCANETGSVQGRILDEDFIPHAAEALDDGVLKTLDTEQAEQVLAFTLMGLLRAEVVALEAPNQLSAGARFSEFHKSAGEGAFSAIYLFMQSFLDAYLEMPEDTDPVVVETWGLANLWVLEGIEGMGHAVAEPRDEQFSASVWEAAHQRMAVLRTLGLVEEGEYYSLPGFVAAFLTDVDEEIEDEDLGRTATGLEVGRAFGVAPGRTATPEARRAVYRQGAAAQAWIASNQATDLAQSSSADGSALRRSARYHSGELRLVRRSSPRIPLRGISRHQLWARN